MVSSAFLRHARLAAKNLRIDALPLIVTPHPLNDLDADQVRDLARACYPWILVQLTGQGELPQDAVIDYIHPNARSRPAGARELPGAGA